MTNEAIQSIMNSTFSGLTFFCRDVELADHLISKYQPNKLLLERGFTDVTHKIGGLGKKCRYLVASSKGKDLSMFSPNPEFGHITIQSGAFYKVLDIQKENGKTQILLLHIPQEGLQLFGNSKINIEEEIIAKGIEIFKKSIVSTPLPELQSKLWIDRTSFPIGMNDEGIFFMDANQSINPSSTTAENTTNAAQPTSEKEAPSIKPSDEPKTASVQLNDNTTDRKKGFWSKLFGK